MKKIKNIALIGMIAAGALCSSCSEDFLKPDPLSFYEPEQTFTTEAGLRSVVATLDTCSITGPIIKLPIW